MRSLALASLLAVCATPKPSAPAGPVQPPPALTVDELPVPLAPTATRSQTADDAMCREAGSDFAYSPLHRDGVRVPRCGSGPGTPCTDADAAVCADDRILRRCVLGRLSDKDCRAHCQHGLVDQTQHDHGRCGRQGVAAACLCCDAGEPGCEGVAPIGPSNIFGRR